MTEPNQSPQSSTSKKKVTSVGLKWIIMAVLTAFLLGILTGMSIQKAREVPMEVVSVEAL
jgi:hypothetical protein